MQGTIRGRGRERGASGRGQSFPDFGWREDSAAEGVMRPVLPSPVALEAENRQRPQSLILCARQTQWLCLSRRRREECVRLCVWLWVVRVADSFACSQVRENQIVIDKNLR